MAQSVPTLVSRRGSAVYSYVRQVFLGPSKTMDSTQFHAFLCLKFFGDWRTLFYIKMKFKCLLLLTVLPIFANAQVNQYDRAAELPITNTYVPINFGDMYLMARAKALKEKHMQEQFDRYSRIANEELKRYHVNSFIDYAHAALNCGYYNSNLYYNLGVSYSILGKRWKAKQYLRKASRKGHYKAPYALKAIRKRKSSLSYSWLIF